MQKYIYHRPYVFDFEAILHAESIMSSQFV